MKKTTFFTILFFLFILFFIPSHKLVATQLPTNSISTQISTTIHVTLWQQVVKACKALAKYTIKSKHVHGASIGTISAGVLNLIIKALHHYYKTRQTGVILIHKPIKQFSPSFLLTLLAAIYGTYFSNYVKKPLPEVGLHTLLVSVILGVAYTIWKEIKEKFSEDDEEQFGIVQNSKNGLYQALLCATSFITSYYTTKKLKTLNY